MSKFTSAYISLIGRLNEVEDLRKTAALREREDAVGLRGHINALCRGAVVLLSAHVEAYVRELGEIVLTEVHSQQVARNGLVDRFFYHISKAAIGEIQDTADHDQIAKKFFDFLATESPFWSKTGAFPSVPSVEKFNKGFSNPAFDKIRAYFNRFGFADYKGVLRQELGVNFHVTTNMVDHMVHTRNRIAHGDPAATKTPSDLKDMMRIIRQFCMATDLVFGSWCKNNICCIR